MRLNCRPVLLSLVLVVVAGCTEAPGPPPPPVKSATSPATETSGTVSATTTNEDSSSSSERKAYNGLKFIVPAGWEEVPLSQMQMGILAAKFSMPAAGPDVVLTLSRSGGSLDDNLDRWRGQFTSSRPEKVETISIAGIQSTMIDLEGGFSPGMGRPDMSSARMLGAIVPMEGQGYFIKLTGPVDQVNAVEADFKDFVKSAARE